jgi:hypothetical protein
MLGSEREQRDRRENSGSAARTRRSRKNREMNDLGEKFVIDTPTILRSLDHRPPYSFHSWVHSGPDTTRLGLLARLLLHRPASTSSYFSRAPGSSFRFYLSISGPNNSSQLSHLPPINTPSPHNGSSHAAVSSTCLASTKPCPLQKRPPRRLPFLRHFSPRPRGPFCLEHH